MWEDILKNEKIFKSHHSLQLVTVPYVVPLFFVYF